MAASSFESTTKAGWLGRALRYAVIYCAVGVLFAVFASHSTSFGARFWRLAAWVVSAIAFGTHIHHERVTDGRTSFASALHAATASALGAFGLALGAIVHRHAAGLARSGLLSAALILWPVITFIPALLVGMAAATLMRPRAPAP